MMRMFGGSRLCDSEFKHGLDRNLKDVYAGRSIYKNSKDMLGVADEDVGVCRVLQE